MDAKIKNFFLKMPDEKRILAMIVRDIFLSTSKKISEDIKWNNLTFICDGNIAFVYTYKNADYINVGFMRALQLSDPSGLFEGSGKSMRHIKIASEKDIPKGQLKKWIKEAMKLNSGE